MTNPIDNSEDIIDSRDIIARIDELDELAEEGDDALHDDERDELDALKAFAEDAEEVSDWSYGEAFIRDSYFPTYAQELADDIGAIDADAKWPLSCIDWEQAARELQQDYTPYEFDGVTYWARA